MDFTPIISQVFSTLWYLIPLAILAVVLKSSWFKGAMGELIVNLSAKYLLDQKHYRLIKNVTLPAGDGTTQIDHVIVSVYGVPIVSSVFYKIRDVIKYGTLRNCNVMGYLFCAGCIGACGHNQSFLGCGPRLCKGVLAGRQRLSRI